jgi:CoA-transferase family III
VLARNKRAGTLNLSHPAGREILERLAAGSDVLIENFRPGVMEKWGLGPDRLHEVNPALVLSLEESRRLFIARAGEARPAAAPGGEQDEAVLAICGAWTGSLWPWNWLRGHR